MREKDNAGYIWRGNLPEGAEMTEPWDPLAPARDINSLVPDSDPRSLAAEVEMTHRRTPEGHLEAVANGTWIAAKKEPQEVYKA